MQRLFLGAVEELVAIGKVVFVFAGIDWVVELVLAVDLEEGLSVVVAFFCEDL